MDPTVTERSPMTMQSTALARLAVGLAQGVALWFLQQALDARSWAATDGLLFAPLLAVALFLPVIVLIGLGNLRLRTLVPWTTIALALCAGLAAYDLFRNPIAERVVPSWQLWLALVA